MKKSVFLLLVMFVIGSVTLPACAQAPKPAPTVPGVPAPAPAPPGFGGGGDDSLGGVPAPSQPAQPDRMVVRSGEMQLIVADVLKSRDDVSQLATRLGGYVVSSSLSGREEGLRATVAIRMPDDKFEEALSELRLMAVRVNLERSSSQDVTEEYVDLQARLKNAEATEAQYLEILQRANTVEDILRVQERLSQVRREIEQTKGRMQFLERQSAMSVITVSLQPESSARPIAAPGYSLIETMKAASRGFVTVGRVLLDFSVWLLIFVPIWGIPAAIIYWWRRRRKRASS